MSGEIKPPCEWSASYFGPAEAVFQEAENLTLAALYPDGYAPGGLLVDRDLDVVHEMYSEATSTHDFIDSRGIELGLLKLAFKACDIPEDARCKGCPLAKGIIDPLSNRYLDLRELARIRGISDAEFGLIAEGSMQQLLPNYQKAAEQPKDTKTD